MAREFKNGALALLLLFFACFLALAWHPFQESMFTSGGFDGSVMFWNIGTETDVGSMENVHESAVWSLDWHPVGHILCSGSNDHSTKFWTRGRPGDTSEEKESRSLQAGTAAKASSTMAKNDTFNVLDDMLFNYE